ncbi:two component LuxR family transcriptional regulator, partial [gut metagenome]
MAMADVLKQDGGFRVAGEADSKESALALLALEPDLFVISLDAQSFDALALLQEVKAQKEDIRVIMILSSPEQSGMLMQAIRLRANGYLLRTISPSEFIEQMKKAIRGEMAASEQVTSA